MTTPFFSSNIANAAEIKFSTQYETDKYIYIDGEITEGDYNQLLKLSNELLTEERPIRIQLNSPGGNLLEAIKIGNFVRETFATVKIWGGIS